VKNSVIRIIFVVLICFGMPGCGPSEITRSEALKMFTEVGGVQRVNQEATVIFDRFGTNESAELFGLELTNYPALSALGKPLFVQAGSNGYSSRIEIPFGSHYRRKFTFVFNPNGPVEFPYASRCIQVATNIFVGP
jgi:hypothetical protein